MAIIYKHEIAGIDNQLSEINLSKVTLGVIFISLSFSSVIYDLMLKMVLDLIHYQPKLLEMRAKYTSYSFIYSLKITLSVV